MKNGVTREDFIKSLEATLKLTRIGIERLELIGDNVNIWYDTGWKKVVNIECDSGIAIISDVLKGIYKG